MRRRHSAFGTRHSAEAGGGTGSRPSTEHRAPSAGLALLAVSTLLSAALAIAYLAAGGGAYAPSAVADPCAPREWRDPGDLEQIAEQFTLSALDGAACELGVGRETLAVALATPESRQEFAAEYGIEEAELEAAVRAGVIRAIDDAEAAGAVSPVIATGLRAIAERLPVDEAIAVIEDASGFLSGADGLLDGIGGQIDGLLDSAGELLP